VRPLKKLYNKPNSMMENNQKGNLIVALLISLAVVTTVTVLILSKSPFLNNLQLGIIQPTPTLSPTLPPSSTPVPSVSTEQTEISGILSIIYGDPPPGSGDQQPRYNYSLTDDSGKTTQIKIDSNTRLIGGKSIIDFNRKMVKVKGGLGDSKTLLATSIEIL